MQVYVFHWRDGKIDRGEGQNPADALNNLGYGQGALAALDYWDYAEDEDAASEGAA